MKILVAEDEAVSRTFLAGLLKRWGYDVILAVDGDEAWSVLQQDDAPRVAILDWMMPAMDGVQVCREIRRRVQQPYTYVMLLTAKSQKEDLIEGMQAGADDYLVKPFDPDELQARLRAGRRILDLQESLLNTREAMKSSATHDLLTGLWNREAILGMLRQNLRDRRYVAAVGIVLANIDHFKQVTAVCGPNAGDAIEREVARRIRSITRPEHSIGRTRAGELLVLLPQCYEPEIMDEAEKVRASIQAEPVDILGNSIDVTVSVGVALSDLTRDPDGLLQAADLALRRAKAQGRNAVELAANLDFGELPANIQRQAVAGFV